MKEEWRGRESLQQEETVNSSELGETHEGQMGVCIHLTHGDFYWMHLVTAGISVSYSNPASSEGRSLGLTSASSLASPAIQVFAFSLCNALL